MQQLSPESELAWRSLRRHLERSGGFTLVFVASAYPPAADEVCRRLQAERETVVLPLPAHGERWDLALGGALGDESRSGDSKAALWLALDRGPGDAQADQLRDSVLTSLNQQRTNLERTFHRPLLVALPTAYLPRVWAVAPDLWTIRGMVAELSAPAPELPHARGLTTLAAPTAVGHVLVETPAIAEWHRLAERAKAEPGSVSPFVARAAVEAAMAQRSWEVAKEIAEAGVALARARAKQQAWYDGVRDIAAALEQLGLVYSELGDPSKAEDAFRECLALRHELVKLYGWSATTSQGIAFALHELAAFALSRRAFAEAKTLIVESLEASRRMVAIEGHTRAGMWSVARALLMQTLIELNEEGGVASHDAIEESIRLRRRLVGLTGEVREVLFDLYNALTLLGSLLLGEHRLEEAEKIEEECVSLARLQLQKFGAMPGNRSMLFHSLRSLARVRYHLGKIAEAEALEAEAEALEPL